MPEKRTCRGWKMCWMADGSRITGYVMCANGAITKDDAGYVILESRGYDTEELTKIEQKTLSLKEEWEW